MNIIVGSREIGKVIELEDGRLCSCSYDRAIIIWDNNYKPTHIFKPGSSRIRTIIEMNDYIISPGYYSEKTVTIWNKNTYETIKTIEDVYCENENGISKLKENALIIGGR